MPKFKTVTQYTYSTSHEHTWAERDFNIICVLRTSRTNEQLVRNHAQIVDSAGRREAIIFAVTKVVT